MTLAGRPYSLSVLLACIQQAHSPTRSLGHQMDHNLKQAYSYIVWYYKESL